MRRTLWALSLTFLLLISPAIAGRQAPMAVSPGGSSEFLTVPHGCPTFSWSEIDVADGYELVVYRMTENGEDAESELRMAFPPSTSSWTPSLAQCMKGGDRYAWSVRAVANDGQETWSQPRLFSVGRSSAQEDSVPAVKVVDGRLPVNDAASTGDSKADPTAHRSLQEAPSSASAAPKPNTPAPTAMDIEGGVVADSFTGDGSTLTALDATSLTAGSVGVANGGTGASEAATARTNLGAASQTDYTTHTGNADAHHAPPASLPPSGDAGGDLTGTYPNPTVVDAMARDAEVASVISTHAGMTDVHHTPTVNTDTLAGLLCADGQIAKWDTSGGAWVCSDDEGALVSTIVVSPVGTATENGTALRTVVNGITGNSSTNRFLVKVEPGVYDVGLNWLTVKSYVELEGSGIEATEIKGKVKGTGTSTPHGLIETQNRSAVRRLTARNEPTSTGLSSQNAVIYNKVGNGGQVHIDNVRVILDYNPISSSPTKSWGILNDFQYNSVIWIHDTEIEVQDGTFQHGIYDTDNNYGLPVGSEYPRWVLNDVHIECRSAVSQSYGIWAKASTVEARDVSIRIEDSAVPAVSRGVYDDNSSGAKLDLDGVSVFMRGPGSNSNATAFDINGQSTILRNLSVDIADYTNQKAIDAVAVSDDSLTIMGASLLLRNGDYITGVEMGGGQLLDARIDIRGASDTAYGIDAGSPVLADVSVYASATSEAYAVFAYQGSPVVQNSHLVAATATTAYALYNNQGEPAVRNSHLTATAATNAYGVYLVDDGNDDDALKVTVENSQVEASTAISTDDDYTLYVGGSRLDGTITDASAVGPASMTCVSSWSSSFAALPSGCL